MNEAKIKQRVQGWIVTLSVVILCGKFVAYFMTNSVGILTDAMESIVNVVAGFISLYSLHWAAQPRDKAHPFGHGKVELLSASVEGLLIMFAGLLIIYEGVKRLFDPSQIQSLDIGIIVIAVAGAMNYVMGWYSIRMGVKHHSIALVAGGRHLQSDTYSTIGLVAGLLLLYFTDIKWIDSALALIFGTIIVVTGFSILRKTTANLLDKADEEVLRELVQVIADNRRPYWIDIHNAKVIKYGSFIYMDCDLTLPWYYNVTQGHAACQELNVTLNKVFAERLLFSVHSDPCLERHCEHCTMQDCSYRKQQFGALETITLDEITRSDEERNE